MLLDREICSRRKSPYISYGAKSLSPSALGKLSLSTQLLAVVHYLSRRYAPATYPESHCRNTTAISRTIGTHALAVLTANFFLTFVIPAHASLLLEKSSCIKILLMLHTQPAAITWQCLLQCISYSCKAGIPSSCSPTCTCLHLGLLAMKFV